MEAMMMVGLSPEALDMERMQVVEVGLHFRLSPEELLGIAALLIKEGRNQVFFFHSSGVPAADIGHVPIGRVSTRAVLAMAIEEKSLHEAPLPMPFKLRLKGDLGPPPELVRMPKQKAEWKTTVYGPTNRRRWNGMRTGKSFNRNGTRGR